MTDDSFFCKEETSTAIGMIKEKQKTDVRKKKKVKDKKSNPPQCTCENVLRAFSYRICLLDRACEGVFVPDLTRSGMRIRGLGLVWMSGPTRSDRDQHQTRSRTGHRNLTRVISHVLLSSLLSLSCDFFFFFANPEERRERILHKFSHSSCALNAHAL